MATSEEEAVETYFRHPLSKGTSEDVKRRLRMISWSLIGYPRPTTFQVHRMRKLIEQNLADGPS